MILLIEKEPSPSISLTKDSPVNSEEKKPLSLNEKPFETPIILTKQEPLTVQVSEFLCNCKKSKCLKLYCECFAKGKLCNKLCNCTDCCNKEENCKQRKLALRNTYLKSRKNEKEVEEALDLDLDSFVIPNCNSRSLGCNCKKSHCKKKYCECFDLGRPCGDNCKCEGCRNYLGVKMRKKEKIQRKNEGRLAVTSTNKINTRFNQRNNEKFEVSEEKSMEIDEKEAITPFKIVAVERKKQELESN